jgi:hypothetical protein
MASQVEKPPSRCRYLAFKGELSSDSAFLFFSLCAHWNGSTSISWANSKRTQWQCHFGKFNSKCNLATAFQDRHHHVTSQTFSIWSFELCAVWDWESLGLRNVKTHFSPEPRIGCVGPYSGFSAGTWKLRWDSYLCVSVLIRQKKKGKHEGAL